MSSPRYPDDFSIPQQSESLPAGQPDDTGDALTMQPGYQQPISQSTPPGTYPPAPGQYSPPVTPYYGPNSAPLPPGAYPPPPSYSAPPSMPLTPSYGPTTTPLPGFGAPAPSSQFGLAAAFSMPMVEPTPNIRQGFLITGIGGGVAFLAYFVFGLPWSWPMWLVPVLAALVGALGFVPSVRNRMYGPLTPRNGAMAAMVASGLGLLFLFFVWGGFYSFGFWLVALGLGAGIVGGVLVYRETQPANTAMPMGMMPPMPMSPPPSTSASMPLPPNYSVPTPVASYGQPAAPPTPMIEPTRGMRKGFLIAGIGGAAALIAYFLLPYASSRYRGFSLFDVTARSVRPGDPVWFLPIAAAVVGLLGLFLAVLNRPYSVRMLRNIAIADIALSIIGGLILFIQWAQLYYDGSASQDIGFWLIALGFGVGIVGGVLAFRETQPAGAAASPLPPLGAAEPVGQVGAPTPMPPSSPSAVQKAKIATPRKQENLILAGIFLVFDLISGAWSLILQAALVILVIVGIVGFVKGCAASATLSEHSSCQDFQQASSDAQNKVLQDMLAAHHNSSDNITLERASLNLYCNIYGGSAPIDGIYGSGTNSQLPARVLLVPASPVAFAHHGPARPSAEA